MGSLLTNYYEVTAIIVFGIGFSLLLLNRNIIKKIIGFNFMDNAIYLYLASKGYIHLGKAPILQEGVELYINPIPSGLVLTGIVVSVSVTAFLLALTIRIYYKYHTLNIEEIIALSKKEED